MMEKHKSKMDVKELKRLKKEKKKLKEKELLERLDKTKSLQASLAAKLPFQKRNKGERASLGEQRQPLR